MPEAGSRLPVGSPLSVVSTEAALGVGADAPHKALSLQSSGHRLVETISERDNDVALPLDSSTYIPDKFPLEVKLPFLKVPVGDPCSERTIYNMWGL